MDKSALLGVFDSALTEMAGPEIAAWWRDNRCLAEEAVLADVPWKIVEIALDPFTGYSLGKKEVTVTDIPRKIQEFVGRTIKSYLEIVDATGSIGPTGFVNVVFDSASPIGKPWELDGAKDWRDGECWEGRRLWCLLAYYAVRRGAEHSSLTRERILTEFSAAGAHSPDPAVRGLWQSYWSWAVLWGPPDSRTRFLNEMLRTIDDRQVPEMVANELADTLSRSYLQLRPLVPTLREWVGGFFDRNEDRFGRLDFVEAIIYAYRYSRPIYRGQ